MSLQRKPVVLVTGASKGIGLAATTILLETFDAVVVSISRTRSLELIELSKKHSATFLAIETDITNEEATRQAIGLALKTFQHLDGLILNAGIVEPFGTIGSPETTTNSWRTLFNTNFFSLLYTVQAALPALRSSSLGGRIVFVSSGAATMGTATIGAYNASKAAMNSFCRTLANEEPDVVSVAIRPGMVDTPLLATIFSMGPSVMREQDLQWFVKAREEGKASKPEDAGHIIAALSLKAPKELSGKFVDWDGDDCKDFRRA